MSEDISKFNRGEMDFGALPNTSPLSSEQQKLVALAMAIQASVVQFVNEGLFPFDQQIHFMGHLQDFTNRLYSGEALRLKNTNQTLQVNSKAGNLFFDATNAAFTEGSKNWMAIKELSLQAAKEAEALEQSNSPETLPKYLN